MSDSPEIFTLSNGLRVIHRAVNRPVAHVALLVAAGSRVETEQQQGLAHYLEHCFFKGTAKRKAYHILSRLEDVGGELNAYTSKEETVLHASFLTADYPRATELLSDIALHSRFPAKDCEKEKEVILDEINSYRDNPAENIFDEFEELVFPQHPLGRNILGTPESLRAFTRQDLLDFVAQHYFPENAVFSSVGNISATRLKKLLERYFGEWSAVSLLEQKLEPLPAYQVQQLRQERTGFQTHLILGRRAYAQKHPKQRALALLNNLLGGPGMNSRLNLNIREKYGFTYHLESYYQAYQDSGLVGVYLGTDPGTAERVVQLVHREFKRLRENKLGVLQLSKAKKQILGQLAMAWENNSSTMLGYGKSLLFHEDIESFAQIAADVEALSAEYLQEVAQEIFVSDQMSQLQYAVSGPPQGLLNA